MLENKLNLQVGDVIATIEETWNLPPNTEGVITRVLASGVSSTASSTICAAS